MTESIGIPKAWKQFSYPFVARYDTESNGSIISFDMGFSPQSFEIGGIELINYGKSKTVDQLSRTRSDYAGQEESAPWRKAALARIEEIRKGDLIIQVIDTAGRPVPNAKVSVKMRRHTFAFGTAVAADTLTATGATSDKYREIVTENYNSTPIENHLKWPFWESWAKQDADRAVNWLAERAINMPISGPLVWGGWSNLPDDLKSRQDDKEFMLKRIYDIIPKQMGAYAGKITDWEVVNEPYGQNDLWTVIGYERMADMFRAARKSDPKAHLTINDYPPLDGSATKNEHLKAYYNYIEALLKAKAPVNGIGFQCHFGSNIVSPERVLAGLDRFAKLGLPISITEFDMETTDEDLQRRYMRDFLTAAYSHPSVDAIIMWGFWEGKHWLPTAALYRWDWSIKPNGQAWLDLVKRDWWTNAEGRTGANGGYRTRGFLGVYEIAIKAINGKWKTIYRTLEKGARQMVVRLDDKVEKPPTWLMNKIEAEKELKRKLAAGLSLLSSGSLNMLSEASFGKSESLAVTGQSFTRATRFTVERATEKPWNVQAISVISENISKGDRLKMSFWVRSSTASSGGTVTVNFQSGGPEYRAFSSQDISPSSSWRKIVIEFVAPMNCGAGQAMVVFQMGHQKQSFEVGGLSVINSGPGN